MFTYQDFAEEFAANGAAVLTKAIQQYRASDIYKTAVLADDYNKQQNTTIMKFVKWLYDDAGSRMPDTMSSNHKMCSNFFHRLNTQRVTYSLGNGITFPDSDSVKDALGKDFDTKLNKAGFYSLIHGVAYIFKNLNRCHVFKATEFVPLFDEEEGTLRAGIRFWQIDSQKPMTAVLYEEDGYTRFRSTVGVTEFKPVDKKKAYRITVVKAPADAEPEVINTENYSALPIVPLYGSDLHQSTLVGMRSKIDGFDLIQSGFANDLTDCSEIYWLVSGAGGANDNDLKRFRDRLKLTHIASVPNADDVSISAQTHEIPYAARKELLDNLRASIYEDFGALDVHTISAGATNDHIDAAYQPMDENADEFEYQIIETVGALLALDGISDQVPSFKRNRISNIKETTEVVMMCAPYLSDDMIRAKLPILSSDEIESENERAAAEDIERIVGDDE